MFSYIKLIIFILVLLSISGAILFIDSSMDNINKTMPDISNSIVDGDNDYNEAVKLVNDKYFDESLNKAKSAGDNFNESLNKLKNIRDKFSSDINDVQKEYIDTVVQELELKIDAVDNLINAIECFKVYSNSTGTSYASQANELMYEATMYQHERDEIVNNNTELFKPQKFML